MAYDHPADLSGGATFNEAQSSDNRGSDGVKLKASVMTVETWRELNDLVWYVMSGSKNDYPFKSR
jgi:hypothetical protein